MPGKQETASHVASPALRAAAQALVELHGVAEARRRSGMSQETFLRIVGGHPVRAGSLMQAQAALAPPPTAPADDAALLIFIAHDPAKAPVVAALARERFPGVGQPENIIEVSSAAIHDHGEQQTAAALQMPLEDLRALVSGGETVLLLQRAWIRRASLRALDDQADEAAAATTTESGTP